MTILDRSPRRSARIAGLAFAGALLARTLPAEARLTRPRSAARASGGFFQGLPVRVQAPTPRPTDAGLTGVADGNCYVLRQVVRDRLGASSLRSVRVCE